MILISTQPALLEFTERDLAYHMILEHTIFFILGALSVMVAEVILKLLVSSNNKRKGHLKLTLALFWTKLLRKIFTVNSYVWLILAAGLITFWHIPSVFDFAELHEQIHVAQHVSFVLVGAVGLLATRSLGESFKLFVLFALNGIMGFAGLMFSVLDKPIYLVYSVDSHNNAGTWMLLVCIILLVIVLPSYLIHRTLLHVRIRLTSNSRPSQI
jgi:cytochrome c oxidase assembly factor CtaG